MTPPAIPQTQNSTFNDLLKAIHDLFHNNYSMDAPYINQFYANTSNDLLANIYLLINDTMPGFLQTGAASFFIKANLIVDHILVIAPTPISFAIGSTLGANDIMDYNDVPDRQLFARLIDGGAAGQTIYFTGILPDTIIKIYAR